MSQRRVGRGADSSCQTNSGRPVDFSRPLSNLPFLLRGVQVTLVVSGLAVAAATLLGFLVAYLRLSRLRVLRAIGTTFVATIQSTPIFALLLWIYFVLPALIGLKRPDIYTFGVLTLAVYYGAYFGEVYRAGILAIPLGQREAALSTGMTGAQAMRRIVLPQAFRATLPPFTSICVSAVKESAIIGPVLGVQEIVWHAEIVQGTTLRPAETFFIAALLYVAITYPLTLAGNYLHRSWHLRAVGLSVGHLERPRVSVP